MNKKLLLWSGMLSAVLVLAGGCASNPVQTSSQGNSDLLYDGDAQVLYDAKQKARTGEEAMQLGDGALQVGDIDRALYQFVSAYELDPSLYMALHKVGMIHAQSGKLDRAALAFHLTLKTKPGHAETLIELGLVELRMRRYAQAREHIEQAIESDVQSWRAYNGLGVLADLDQDFKAANQYYEKALELNPNSAVLWNNRGYSSYLAGDWRSAEKYITKALDIDASYQKAWLNLGLIYVRRDFYDKAVDAFERVMDKANAYERVGSLLMVEAKYDVAEHFLNRAIDASPTYYNDAYEQVARLEVLRGDGDDHDQVQRLIRSNRWRVEGRNSPARPELTEGGQSRACLAGQGCVDSGIE